MKNKFLSAIAVLTMMAFASCSDSSDDFNNANGNSAKKYITSVDFVNSEDADGSRELTISYDANGRVTSATDGFETSQFAYSGGNLSAISGSSNPLVISDIMSPYPAYEVGDVLDYDSAGNPIKVKLYERDYDGTILEEYTGTISYDAKPNPYFYTLEAAGIIKVLNEINLNFSMAPAAPDLVMAKMLLPVNNPSKIEIKYMSGAHKGRVVADYVYDNDNYPTSATFTETSEDNSTHIYAATYEYRN